MKAKKEIKKYDCADIEHNVQRFIDGQLGDHELKMFEEHLNNCLPCDKKVEFEKRIIDIVKRKLKSDYPTDRLINDLNKIIAN